MIVVSNTSPLIALARAGRLDLLQAIHGEIIVPDAVFNEITVAGAGEPGAHEVATMSWIKRQPALNRQLVNALGLDLDAGEAEAIALAMECQADLILLDERMGRHAAQRMGLKVTGTLGILIAAKDLLDQFPFMSSKLFGASRRWAEPDALNSLNKSSFHSLRML